MEYKKKDGISGVYIVFEIDCASEESVEAKADLLIIMSDIDGLYDKDPHTYDDARLIPVVHEITDDIRALAGGAGTKLGTGGMITKLNAVEIAYDSDIDVVLMNGQHPKTLYDLFDGKTVGTFFCKKPD